MSDLNQSARLNRNDGASSLNRATFVAEPLESGFGLTLGNALRRVLLSSLQGAAVTAIRIDNVLHEFSGLAGVRDDVVDIVQNVKQIALRMQGESSKRLQLSVTGPAEVTAGMIATSADIEVMNPELVICHVDDSATLNMELTASVGRGYAPAAANRPPEAPLGLIPVDALYSPIRQVAYQVEELSLEHGTTADRLSITIQTDGSVEPQDALSYAAIILQDQLHLFTNSESSRDPTASSDSSNVKPSDFADLPSSRSDTILSDVSHLNRFLVRKIEEFELSVRSMNGLKGDNIIYVGDLAKRTEAEMLRTPNFGRKSLTEVKEMLAVMGLRLGMNIPGWPPENIEPLAQAFAEEPKFSGRY